MANPSANPGSASNAELTGGSAVDWLFSEASALSLALKKLPFASFPNDDLMISGSAVLSILLEHGARTVPHIADLRQTSRQNIQILINRLAAARCVELVPNPHHKRSQLVRITSRGREMLTNRRQLESRMLADLASRLPLADLQSAAALLQRLRTELGASNTVSASTKDKKEVRTEAPVSPVSKPEPAPDTDNSLPVNLL